MVAKRWDESCTQDRYISGRVDSALYKDMQVYKKKHKLKSNSELIRVIMYNFFNEKDRLK